MNLDGNSLYMADIDITVPEFDSDQEAEKSDAFQNTKKNHKLFLSDTFNSDWDLIDDFQKNYNKYKDTTKGYGIINIQGKVKYFIGHN